jgi:D-galactose 1-dehydrogenase/L-arabinose 1- dehydrogenase
MPSQPYRIALLGIGNIARAQHLPALSRAPSFQLVAAADPVGRVTEVPGFPSLDALLAEGPALDAISVCTPPAGRAALVAAAIDAGLHVMLEKPPTAALSEIEMLRARAAARGVTLFASWHSREAGAVAPARAWLQGKRVKSLLINWKEDIRRWHPGQDWILGPGGYGVFDPGINALSIATAILPEPLTLTAATMIVPAHRQSPIAATLELSCGEARGVATFDFLQQGQQQWDIEIVTDAGRMALRNGGQVLDRDGTIETFADEEYPRLYSRFAELIAAGKSDVDASPHCLVADVFLLATRQEGAPFEW